MTKMEPNLSVARNLKIAVFHLGSGMADVLTTGVWNRIMISDLGFQATPIGLLISLRYFWRHWVFGQGASLTVALFLVCAVFSGYG
jgi:hypothetical protein